MVRPSQVYDKGAQVYFATFANYDTNDGHDNYGNHDDHDKCGDHASYDNHGNYGNQHRKTNPVMSDQP